MVSELATYVHDVLGVRLRMKAWSGAARLPLHLVNEYEYFTAELYGRNILFMCAHGRLQTPGVIQRHMDAIAGKWKHEFVYVRIGITSGSRKRLIAAGIPFIVPASQMYLPALAMDLRERFDQTRVRGGRLGFVAQQILLRVLYHSMSERLSLNATAEALRVTNMTISRAFDEIEQHGLAVSERSGRTRVLVLRCTGLSLWERANALMRSPVRKRLVVDAAAPLSMAPHAGLDALARRTLLAEPDRPVRAVHARELSRVEQYVIVGDEAFLRSDAIDVEVWEYDPTFTAVDDGVDDCSLYLSLQSDPDERIQNMLTNMMEHHIW